MVIEPETSVPYDRHEWGGWRKTVDTYLRWKKDGCVFAFYTDKKPDCLATVDRDHLVSVKEAHDSGGHAWEKDVKRDFYNHVKNLYVMHKVENIRKSHKDPAEWKPTDKDDWCRYAVEWISVKQEHRLSADKDEAKHLLLMLDTCP